MSFLGKNPQRAKHGADDAGHFACGKVKRGADPFDRVRDLSHTIFNPVRVILQRLNHFVSEFATGLRPCEFNSGEMIQQCGDFGL